MKEPTWLSRPSVLAFHGRLLAEHGGDTGIRDEGLKLAEAFRKRYPEHSATKRGDATYRLGEYYRDEGRWAQALECYKKMSDHPKHWTHRRHEDRPTRIEDRISEMLRKLKGDR